MRRSKTLGPYSVRFVLEEREKQPLIEEMMNVFPFILEELGMIALMEVVFPAVAGERPGRKYKEEE